MRFLIGVLSVASFSILGWLMWIAYLEPSEYPVGIVVPHHDLVAPARAAYLSKLGAEYQPKTIILLSPDHFNQNNTPITSTGRDWETSLGPLMVNTGLLEALKLPLSATSFEHEHGITTLLKDIKQYFREATIVPIMIGRNATYAQVANLIQDIYRNCSECFLIASVDFSHVNATTLADLHDQTTLRELYEADAVALYRQAEVDSPETLAALVLWSALHNKSSFQLFSHTNSGRIAGITVGEVTSHIIGGYYAVSKDTNDTHQKITMMIGGDVMFAREVEYLHTANPRSSVFSRLGERFFWGVDIALINLEGVFSETNNHVAGWNELPPRLQFDASFATLLKQNRVSAVGLANNHTFDAEKLGADFTKATLNTLAISALGYPRGSSSVLLKEVGDIKVAVIAIATHEPVEDIAREVIYFSGQGYKTVVYIHWGQEYIQKPTAAQEEMAKRLVDAGADLVVGSHPHVFQEVSVYKGVPIIYSLGNFLFDQNFKRETQIGAVLGVSMSDDGTEIFLLPIKSYLATEIIAEPEHTLLLEQWNKPWAPHRTKNDTFYFPATN